MRRFLLAGLLRRMMWLLISIIADLRRDQWPQAMPEKWKIVPRSCCPSPLSTAMPARRPCRSCYAAEWIWTNMLSTTLQTPPSSLTMISSMKSISWLSVDDLAVRATHGRKSNSTPRINSRPANRSISATLLCAPLMRTVRLPTTELRWKATAVSGWTIRLTASAGGRTGLRFTAACACTWYCAAPIFRSMM